ncbi:flagellar biosynthesis GTPase FlhF [Bradyrhizobium sp. GM5.1]
MRFSKDRCSSCGKPTSSRYKTIGDFYFCSSKCYDDEVYKSVPKQFGQDKTYLDDPEISEIWHDTRERVDSFNLRDEIVEESFQRWLARSPFNQLKIDWICNRNDAVRRAQDKLEDLLEAETTYQRAEEQRKTEEREEKDRTVREREEAKLAEKQRKMDEEEADREAEEAKWRPKPFRL